MNKGTCTVPICDRPVARRDWCNPHYLRLLRHGDVQAHIPVRQSLGVEERFWSKVNKDGPIPAYRPDLGPCWLYTGNTPKLGYGLFWLDGTKIGAHVAAYQFTVGPVPTGKELDHRCRVKRCVKTIRDEHGPAHVDPVTHLENMRRAQPDAICLDDVATCLHGHPLLGDNLYIYPSGKRDCRTCRRVAQRAYLSRRAQLALLSRTPPTAG